MVSPVRFNGQDLYIPGYYAKRDISRLQGGGATGSRLLLIAECKGGVPYNASTSYPNANDRVNWVSNTDEAKSVLRDGPGYYGTLFSLNPSNDPAINGAPAVGVIRVNKATQSIGTVLDVDSATVLDLKSDGFGLYTQQIQYKISAGTNKGKKVSVKFEGNSYETDDITYEEFSVVYTGAGSACALVIDPAGNLATTVTGGPGGENLAISLAAFDTIGALVANINAHSSGTYTAVVVGDTNFETAKLDKVTAPDAINIKTTAYTVKAILQAVMDHFNNNNDYINATLYSGAVRRVPINMASYVFLSGGTEGGSVTQTEWDGALSLAKLIDASFVLAATSDVSVGASLSAHVSEMNGVNGRNERQGGFGSVKSASKATRLAASSAINNSAIGYFATDLKRYDKNGNETIYDGFYGMCAIAGISAGNDIVTPPTNKSLNVLSAEESLTITDKNDYIKGGVMVAQPSDQGGVRVVRSITTYQGSNLIANEWSMMRTILYITKDHRTYVETMIGEPGTIGNLKLVQARALDRLDFYVNQGYFVIDPAFGNAYRNVKFTVDGDVVKIDYEGTLVSPINFILVTHHFTVIGQKS